MVSFSQKKSSPFVARKVVGARSLDFLGTVLSGRRCCRATKRTAAGDSFAARTRPGRFSAALVLSDGFLVDVCRRVVFWRASCLGLSAQQLMKTFYLVQGVLPPPRLAWTGVAPACQIGEQHANVLTHVNDSPYLPSTVKNQCEKCVATLTRSAEWWYCAETLMFFMGHLWKKIHASRRTGATF